MREKRRIGLLFSLIAVVVGSGGLLLAQRALHRTSDTAFCLSCHSISKPFEEYRGTVHFSNQKGVRAECTDRHIPKSGMNYLFAGLEASKGIYREFVSGKIDSDDEFEAHRQKMAETVWEELKATGSTVCRSCRSFDAMGITSQSESAQRMHSKTQKDDETYIDCHKGIAHFPSEIKVDDNAAREPESQAATSVTNGTHIYPFKTSRISNLATVTPGANLTVADVGDKQPIVRLQGYQIQGSENMLYLATGQRLTLTTLSEKGIRVLMVSGE